MTQEETKAKSDALIFKGIHANWADLIHIKIAISKVENTIEVLEALNMEFEILEAIAEQNEILVELKSRL